MLVAGLSRFAARGTAFARQVAFLDERFRQTAPQAEELVGTRLEADRVA